MRAGVAFFVTVANLDRRRALIGDRNAAQKHVWRARIVLLPTEGLGANAIMSRTGKSKTCVWRCRNASPPRALKGCWATRRGPRASRNPTPLSPGASWR